MKRRLSILTLILLGFVLLPTNANAIDVPNPISEFHFESRLGIDCAQYGKIYAACIDKHTYGHEHLLLAPGDSMTYSTGFLKYDETKNRWINISSWDDAWNNFFSAGKYKYIFSIQYNAEESGMNVAPTTKFINDTHPDIELKYEEDLPVYDSNGYRFSLIHQIQDNYYLIWVTSDEFTISEGDKPLDFVNAEYDFSPEKYDFSEYDPFNNPTFYTDTYEYSPVLVALDDNDNYLGTTSIKGDLPRGVKYFMGYYVMPYYYRYDENTKYTYYGEDFKPLPFYDYDYNELYFGDFVDLRYTFKFLSGNNQKFFKKKIGGYSFLIDAPASGGMGHLDTLSVNNIEYVKDEDYVVEDVDQQAQITFTEKGLEKLNGLEAGEYEIKAVFDTILDSFYDIDETVIGGFAIEIPNYTYTIIEGDNQKFDISSVSEFKIRIDGDFDLFDSLYIGDEEFVRDEDYIVSEGSTIIEFTEKGIAKLNALEAGIYDIVAKYSNDKNATGTLTISAPIEVPFTFDSVVTWFALGAVSLLGIDGTIIFAKKLN